MSAHSIVKRGRPSHEPPADTDSMEVGMRRHVPCLLALAVALIVWCTAASAHADSIVTITSGSFSFNPDSSSGAGPLILFGTNGFSFIGGAQFGVTGPKCCLSPGTETQFFGRWIGNDLPGVVTLGGETFTNVGGLNSVNRASVDFESAPFTLPPIGASATIVAPFTLTGTFVGTPGNGNFPAQPTVAVQFIGSGIGTLPLTPSLGQLWDPGTVSLTIIPEPSTMVFTGTALLLLGYWGRKRLFRGRQHVTGI